MVTANQLATYRRVQKRIEADFERDLRAIWAKASKLDPVRSARLLEQAFPALIDKYGLQAGAVAADWFESLTDVHATVPDSFKPEAFQASARWAVGERFTDTAESVAISVVADRLVSSGVRHVRQHARDTIDASARNSGGRVFYARKVMGETCDFCLILASRGPVYGSETSARLRGADGNVYHDDCDCQVVPVKGEWVPDETSPRGARWVGQDPGYDFEKLYAEEYKPYWNENDDIKDVLKRRRVILRKETNKRSSFSESLTDGLVPGEEKKKPGSKLSEGMPPSGGWPSGRGGKDEAVWAKRQARLKSDTSGEFLATHEIEFLEKFEALGHRVTWIPRDIVTRKSTNDFIWLDVDMEVCELKVTSAKYSTIKSHIQSAAVKAMKNHGVVKDCFVIDLGSKSLSPKLETQLAKYNARVKDGHIRRLWVMSEDGKVLKELHLE